ncbi:hypothetical protein HQN87_06035 [Paenibacillus tritici]|uniref:Copper amine oxidase-like N-terminal domain-containing protein n=1 Tax=Paenibacillus tritici TaxID=1873425 RepID=A0ABX2DM33_9BACL|nr:hypothetical protein [Paenibacillus tritici]NQX44881.1 hypothetical protein [Paenibacillus tritici]
MTKTWHGPLRTVIIASMLLGFVSPLTAHAAEEIYVYDSYTSKSSGVRLYSVSQVDGDKYINAVIARQPDGTYAKWQEPFQYFRKNDKGMLQLTGKDDPEQAYMYDTQSQSIVRQSDYTLSPDGRWGILERSRYARVPANTSDTLYEYTAKFNDQYLRNTATGKVSVYHSTTSYYHALWINQHTLLESGYNEAARQNVISTYDPSTGKRHELLKGTLNNWNLTKGILQYVKNEPKRQPWIYSLKDGSSRLVKDSSELEVLFPVSPSPKPEASLPQDMVLKDLPVMEMPITLAYEYNVNLDGASVDVSTIFSEGGQDWIPVKPLAAALGWKLEVMNITQTGDPSAAYIYKITNNGRAAVLTPVNSFNLASRLYIAPAQLKELGYKSIKLTPYLK